MLKLKDLEPEQYVQGIVHGETSEIVSVKHLGDTATNVVYRTPKREIKEITLYVGQQDLELQLVDQPSSRTFQTDGGEFKLVSEALRIQLAHLFDLFLAVTTSDIETYPHQITAVYGEMLRRQPLKFLLADDPGAGKTIMAGLLIKELIIRGDVERCLVVAPGSLVEQWRDELWEKFQLSFDFLTKDRIENYRRDSHSWGQKLFIARLDVLSRNLDLQNKLRSFDEWDLIVCDEAHRMSATMSGTEIHKTKRYRLGEFLGDHTRHFLLLTATPHNGKRIDFELFMKLIDRDRFEAPERLSMTPGGMSDLMRRVIKENLIKFDGRPIFPERIANTVNYNLSKKEKDLYTAVTQYVSFEMSRAEKNTDTEGKRNRVNVNFALQMLQRRLASSPAAIHQSLQRRRLRLTEKLKDNSQDPKSYDGNLKVDSSLPDLLDDGETDIDDLSAEEIEKTEEEFSDRATASRTISDLKAEIKNIQKLENKAKVLVESAEDAKWLELKSILDDRRMKGDHGFRHKLIIFTEHRDTLVYLAEKIKKLEGFYESVLEIHGGVPHQKRREIVEKFTHDRSINILVANDAAGEGINLQCAHLMVNYDLPWNPNRLEQRFGRIHRIGQTEVCHCWNLVATNTREGRVYQRLLEKIGIAADDLGGQVYDVLGQLFQSDKLSDLLLEAIRYGEKPEVRNQLIQKVDKALDENRLNDLINNHALAINPITDDNVKEIRNEIERADAHRLQPFYVKSFFVEAFKLLGGKLRTRETGCWEIFRVPKEIRDYDAINGKGLPVQERYQRICFDKKHLGNSEFNIAFICPGHPLLDAIIGVVLEKYEDLLEQGTVLIDDIDKESEPRILYFFEHQLQDERVSKFGNQQIISKRIIYVEITKDGRIRNAGPAPYLDYRPPEQEESSYIKANLTSEFLFVDSEQKVEEYLIDNIGRDHLEKVRQQRLPQINKEENEIRDRLSKEIEYWTNHAKSMRQREERGDQTSLPALNSESTVRELKNRLVTRVKDLERQRRISPLPPRIIGAVKVVPGNLLNNRFSAKNSKATTDVESKKEVERLAMLKVMSTEQMLGHTPVDVSEKNYGYDIESWDYKTDRLRMIEVKGRVAGARVVTVTRNEILTSLNKCDDYILAIVEISNGHVSEPVYVDDPFQNEPDFHATSVNFKIKDLIEMGCNPL